MSDRAVLLVGLVVVAALAWFISSWFSWSTLLWILGSTVAIFVGANVLMRFASTDEHDAKRRLLRK